MELPLHLVATAPRALLATGIGACLLAVWLLLWLLKRIGLRLVGRARRPISFIGAMLTLFTALGAGLLGVAAIATCVALHGYRGFLARAHVAEVQCIELAPQKLRLYYVGIEPDGRRGPTETYELDGDEWTVGGEVLRFRPILSVLGLSTVYGVKRVEGRWREAAQASAHRPTAYDRDGGKSRSWILLERHGTRGPLAWLVAGVHGQAVSQQPDRRALYDLYVTRDGFVLETRAR